MAQSQTFEREIIYHINEIRRIVRVVQCAARRTGHPEHADAIQDAMREIASKSMVLSDAAAEYHPESQEREHGA